MAKAAAGYSTTPLARKLGLKDGFRIRLIDPPAHYFALLGPLPEGVREVADEGARKDLIHLFATSANALSERLAALKSEIEPNGMIWVSWPKKAAKIGADLSDRVVREAALAVGLVDVKVCAVDDVWSALKLMIPVRDRG